MGRIDRYGWGSLTEPPRPDVAPEIIDDPIRIEFEYDYRWRGTRRSVKDAQTGRPISSTQYVWDDPPSPAPDGYGAAGWLLIAELDALNNDAVLRSYMWGLDLSGSLEGAGGIGGLLAMTTASGDAYFYAYDGNGNVVQLVESAGSGVAAEYLYEAFGRVLAATGPAADENPIRFSTKQFCAASELVDYGFRSMRPEIGAWLSRDPLGIDGGANEYGLLGNSPPNAIDPHGLDYFFDTYVYYEMFGPPVRTGPDGEFWRYVGHWLNNRWRRFQTGREARRIAREAALSELLNLARWFAEHPVTRYCPEPPGIHGRSLSSRYSRPDGWNWSRKYGPIHRPRNFLWDQSEINVLWAWYYLGKTTPGADDGSAGHYTYYPREIQGTISEPQPSWNPKNPVVRIPVMQTPSVEGGLAMLGSHGLGWQAAMTRHAEMDAVLDVVIREKKGCGTCFEVEDPLRGRLGKVLPEGLGRRLLEEYYRRAGLPVPGALSR